MGHTHVIGLCILHRATPQSWQVTSFSEPVSSSWKSHFLVSSTASKTVVVNLGRNLSQLSLLPLPQLRSEHPHCHRKATQKGGSHPILHAFIHPVHRALRSIVGVVGRSAGCVGGSSEATPTLEVISNYNEHLPWEVEEVCGAFVASVLSLPHVPKLVNESLFPPVYRKICPHFCRVHVA